MNQDRDDENVEMADEEDGGSGPDEEEQGAGAGRAPGGARRVVPFHQFLRLVGALGGELGDDDFREPNDNAELVRRLESGGSFTDPRVKRALLTAPRGAFLPPDIRGQAYHDTPLRITEFGFNVSAPSMWATMLQALDVQPGMLVLDVGCGCGATTAYLSLLAGPEGFVRGIDIREGAVRLARRSLEALSASSPAFAQEASPIEVERRDVFLPVPQGFRKLYDRIFVGSACPGERVKSLLRLLRPGGTAVVPVESDLRLYTWPGDGQGQSGAGSPRYTVITQVRFTDLEVPSDAAILGATMESLRADRLSALLSAPPSTFEEDMRGVDANAMYRAVLDPFNPPASVSPPDVELRGGSWGHGNGLGPSAAVKAEPSLEEAPGAHLSPRTATPGPFGSDQPPWSLRVHKSVLLRRCEYARARAAAGMSDSLSVVTVPEHFSGGAAHDLVEYMYTDAVLDGHSAVDYAALCHLAAYLGMDRLVRLTEGLLAAELTDVQEGTAGPPAQDHGRVPPGPPGTHAQSKGAQEKVPAGPGGAGVHRPPTPVATPPPPMSSFADACEAAPHLFLLGQALVLEGLKLAAVDFMARHFPHVLRSDGFSLLTKDDVSHIAAHLAAQQQELETHMKQLGELRGFYPPSVGYALGNFRLLLGGGGGAQPHGPGG